MYLEIWVEVFFIFVNIFGVEFFNLILLILDLFWKIKGDFVRRVYYLVDFIVVGKNIKK